MAGKRHGDFTAQALLTIFGRTASCVRREDRAILTRPSSLPGNATMRFSHRIRAALVALISVVGVSVASAAYADSGTIWISEYKGGWVIGASGGSGTLVF